MPRSVTHKRACPKRPAKRTLYILDIYAPRLAPRGFRRRALRRGLAPAGTTPRMEAAHHGCDHTGIWAGTVAGGEAAATAATTADISDWRHGLSRDCQHGCDHCLRSGASPACGGGCGDGGLTHGGIPQGGYHYFRYRPLQAEPTFSLTFANVYVLVSFVSALASPATRFAVIIDALCAVVVTGLGTGFPGPLVIRLWERLTKLSVRFTALGKRPITPRAIPNDPPLRQLQPVRRAEPPSDPRYKTLCRKAEAWRLRLLPSSDPSPPNSRPSSRNPTCRRRFKPNPA